MTEISNKPKVYLAGPMVFYADPAATFDIMKDICAKHDLNGCAPIDNQMGLEGIDAGEALMIAIAKADFALMDECDAGIFCLDPFRRCPEMDPGTAVELGYMKAQGKVMTGWTIDGSLYPNKVQRFLKECYDEDVQIAPPNETGATSGSARDGEGLLLHSAGMVQNLMTEGGIRLSGGKVFSDPDWKIAFDRAATCLAETLKKQ
jgi:nucleoside 2-deoxyribosyltransferase